MNRSGFDPVHHGFHFENTFVNRVGPVRTYGLCGGMSLAAARYYKHHVPIPMQIVLPRENSMLRNYIYGCQMESYGPLGLISTANWITMPGITFDEQFRWCLGEFDRLRPRVDRDEPVVIGLRSRRPGDPMGHQVLAIGYDRSPRRVLVYDPNYPDQGRLITMEESRRRLVYSDEDGSDADDNRWSSFFITGCSIGNQAPPLITTVN
jgi:hypothetical protein